MIRCCCVSPGGGSHVEELNKVSDELCADFWQFIIDERPEFAVYRGIHHCRGTLDSYSLDMYRQRKDVCLEFHKRLAKVSSQFFCVSDHKSLTDDHMNHKEYRCTDAPLENGTSKDVCSVITNHHVADSLPTCSCRNAAVNLAILKYYVDTCLAGIDFKRHLLGYNYWEGVDVYFIKYTLERLSFSTKQDYRIYLNMLNAFPCQVSETMELLKEGLNIGVISHTVSIVPSVPNRLQSAVKCEPNLSPFYQPFNDIPASIDKTTRLNLQDLGLKAVRDGVQASLSDLLKFIVEEYVPHLRTEVSVNSMPYCNVIGKHLGEDGIRRDMYESLLRYFTSVDSLTPLEVHERGVAELKSVFAKFDRVKEKLNFKGTTKEFGLYMQSLSERYFETPEEILEASRHVVFDVIRPKLPQLFYDIPQNFNLSIRPFPHNKDVAKAVYNGPPLDGSSPGILWVSISNPQRFSRSELYTLMLHEVEPGHHLQSCVALANPDLPLFRKLKDDRRFIETPGCFPSNEAYTEGWAMYCEGLGYEMGLYEDPQAEYSHLCSEMMRSCRMIVDTGIHALGWTREQAVRYMEENTLCGIAGINREIDRYITWPAQGCAYTIGQIKFRELRAKVEKALGADFDIRQFHKVCLDCGQVPLDILEDIINNYIAQRLKSTIN